MEGMGLPKSYMSVIPGKYQSGIYREFNRNGSGGVYTGNEAQGAGGQGRPDNKPDPKTDDYAPVGEITALFKKDLSPDQISGRLKVNYPDRPEKRSSTSTIYTHIYQGMTKDPSPKDRFGQKQAEPRKRSGAKDRRGQITGRISIDERPDVVEQKSRAGDREGDTVERAGKSAYMATFVDRKTKFLLAKPMPNKRAETVDKAAVRAFRGIAPDARNTLAPDNGKGFAAHGSLPEALSIDIFLRIPITGGSGVLTNIPTG
jgi:IS30 family transposase